MRPICASQSACAFGFLKPGPLAISTSAETRSGCASVKCCEARPPNDRPPTTARWPGAAQSSTRAEVVHHLRHRVGRRALGRVREAVAAVVPEHDAEAGRSERLDLRAEVLVRLAVAGREHDRLARPVRLGVDAGAVARRDEGLSHVLSIRRRSAVAMSSICFWSGVLMVNSGTKPFVLPSISMRTRSFGPALLERHAAGELLPDAAVADLRERDAAVVLRVEVEGGLALLAEQLVDGLRGAPPRAAGHDARSSCRGTGSTSVASSPSTSLARARVAVTSNSLLSFIAGPR